MNFRQFKITGSFENTWTIKAIFSVIPKGIHEAIYYARNSEVAKEITAYACMHSGVKTLLTMTTNKTEFQQYLRQINGADSEFYLIKYKPHPVMDRI
ncbi:MAG: hypothetical protein KDC80_08655 [Saprospiraceae bacterium]|nr:hypothetical protein [Saprospiraceae bacterium]